MSDYKDEHEDEDLSLGFREAILSILGEDASASDISCWFRGEFKKMKADSKIPPKKKTLCELKQMLKNENENVQKRAGELLSLFWEEKGIWALIEGLSNENSWSVATESLTRIGHRAVPALIKALKNKDVWVRISAPVALAKIGAKAVPALIETLKDESSHVRTDAAFALGEIGPKAQKAIPALAEALKDKSEDVRKAARVALEKI